MPKSNASPFPCVPPEEEVTVWQRRRDKWQRCLSSDHCVRDLDEVTLYYAAVAYADIVLGRLRADAERGR